MGEWVRARVGACVGTCVRACVHVSLCVCSRPRMCVCVFFVSSIPDIRKLFPYHVLRPVQDPVESRNHKTRTNFSIIFPLTVSYRTHVPKFINRVIFLGRLAPIRPAFVFTLINIDVFAASNQLRAQYLLSDTLTNRNNSGIWSYIYGPQQNDVFCCNKYRKFTLCGPC